MARSNETDNCADGNAHAAKAGFAAHQFRTASDAVKFWHRYILLLRPEHTYVPF